MYYRQRHQAPQESKDFIQPFQFTSFAAYPIILIFLSSLLKFTQLSFAVPRLPLCNSSCPSIIYLVDEGSWRQEIFSKLIEDKKNLSLLFFKCLSSGLYLCIGNRSTEMLYQLALAFIIGRYGTVRRGT